MSNPKTFLSYSWSSPEHEQWVLNLATELVANGVDIILDKWHLKEGHNAVSFMEKMVTDSSVKKVIIVSDSTYASKADDRSGGVGTETQIISHEIYSQQEQDKFVAVIPSKDENGYHQVPTFYKSRIFIDLSEPETYSENFEKLLRWTFDKPLHVKPPLGKKPQFLNDANDISLGTTTAFNRTVSALRQNKSYSSAALDDYISLFVANFENFRIQYTNDEYDDCLVDNIKQFLPIKTEVLTLFNTIAQFPSVEENTRKLHRFFEKLIPYCYPRPDQNTYRTCEFDNFKFIISELFLSLIAILLKHEKFQILDNLLSQEYYLDDDIRRNDDSMKPFILFNFPIESLEDRKRRLKLNRISLRADFLKSRSEPPLLDFKHLMQADFVLYIRSLISSGRYYSWHPITLIYADRFHGAFEVFARAKSKRYFEEMKCILGVSNKDEIDNLINLIEENKMPVPKWDFHDVDVKSLLGHNLLCVSN